VARQAGAALGNTRLAAKVVAPSQRSSPNGCKGTKSRIARLGSSAMSAVMAEAKRYVGIDVAKAQLDVALGPNGERFAVANDERGIGVLLKRLEPADLVIIEANRRPGSPVASALATAGIGVAVVNHARCATSRGPLGSWPRPTRSTHKCWCALARRSNPRCERCRTRRPSARSSW